MATEKSTGSETVVTPDHGELAISWAGATDVGRKRENNQDAFLIAFPLFVVADGMGGHAGGELASRSAVDQLGVAAAAGPVTPEAIEQAIARAVSSIASHPDVTDEGTGTTLTGVFFSDGAEGARFTSLNIGDSRVYLLRGDALVQVTTDHSVVQELLDAGRISEEEAEVHPYSNVITRAVGMSDTFAPDYVRIPVAPGDRFVICSDGLTKELTDYGIRHFLMEYADAEDALDAMMSASLENGGRDNVTIIVINIDSAI